MADNTHIEWTDATWNPITGCSVVSAGCKHCYAMKLAGTRLAHHPSRAGLTIDTKAGPVWTGEVRFNEQWLHQPMSWRRPRRIFVCAHGDLFHEAVPDAWIDMVFAVMALSPQHQFQVLTKRAERMRDYLAGTTFDRMLARFGCPPKHLFNISQMEMQVRLTGQPEGARRHYGEPVRWPLPNVWLGVSVEDQAAADTRIPLLLQCPAAVRWISAEPLLAPVNLRFLNLATEDDGPLDDYPDDVVSHVGRGIHWVVAGGESGAGARPMHPDWARSLRDQCAAADVPFLFKQWGEWAPAENRTAPPSRTEATASWTGGAWTEGHQRPTEWMPPEEEPDLYRVGKKSSGRLLDGVLHDGYPVAP